MDELLQNHLFATHAIAASGSVVFGTALTYPLDTIKSLIQVGSGPGKQLNAYQVTKRIRALSGYSGLYSGFEWLAWGRTFGLAARFGIYEVMTAFNKVGTGKNINAMLKPNPQKLIKAFNNWTLAIKNSSSPRQALNFYSQMHRQSVPFNSFSILFTLKSCARLQNPNLIAHLHCHILKLGFVSHVYVSTSLLGAYRVSCFDDACKLFDEMPKRNIVTRNTMITGYSRSGDVNKAYEFFRAMPLKDVASWSAMIAGFMNNWKWSCGLDCFRDMIGNERFKPDEVTVGSVLLGCAHMGSIGLLVGRSVHGFIAKNGWNLSVEIGTVLVDMYAKCGLLKYACIVFNSMQQRNVVTWTALICGSAQHGYSDEALSFFEAMQDMGVKPNEITFTGVLNACARKGLVEEGRKYFDMIEQYGLERRIHHYGCMVDLFGKAGLLEEAYQVIRKMKVEPNVVIWSSFLSACKDHKEFQMADRVIEQVMETVKPENDGGVYSLISDLYVLNEKWNDAERVRKLMVNQYVRKTRGSSYIRC